MLATLKMFGWKLPAAILGTEIRHFQQEVIERFMYFFSLFGFVHLTVMRLVCSDCMNLKIVNKVNGHIKRFIRLIFTSLTLQIIVACAVFFSHSRSICWNFIAYTHINEASFAWAKFFSPQSQRRCFKCISLSRSFSV